MSKMRPKKQLKYVAVGPDGKVNGPMGNNEDEVLSYLIEGHLRSGGDGTWESIGKLGYYIEPVYMVAVENPDLLEV